ncbi:MAG TPA: FecR domain-containing protein [Ohtaekwangia sp.]|uniref:FecR domain-containing protein n=1 Tax=Ohtaekwangia sp. TaxID=2066019 RepID=UPI002F931E54
MNQEYYWHLTNKVLNGHASAAERAELEQWLNRAEENRQLYEQYRSLWQATEPEEPLIDFNADKHWQELRAIVTEPEKRNVVKLYDSKWWLKVAATLALVAIAIYGMTTWMFSAPKTIYVAAAQHERKIIILPDSSRVSLNHGSSLQYPEQFDGDERLVQLTGEAFFEVQRNVHKPFRIKTASSLTEVLGTSFLVRSYTEEKADRVSVATGKVKFSSLQNIATSVLLTPGRTGTLDIQQDKITAEVVRDPNFKAWHDKVLTFEHSQLKDILDILTRCYDTEFTVSTPAILSCRFTGTFDHASLEDILRVLEVSLEVSFTKQGGRYSVQGKGC